MPRTGVVDAGARDRQVTIQQLTESIGSSGFPIEAWSTLTTVFASKEDVAGRERFSTDQLSAPFETKWNIAYRTDMDPESVDIAKKRRIVYQGRTYDVTWAEMIGRYESVDLHCLARQG